MRVISYQATCIPYFRICHLFKSHNFKLCDRMMVDGSNEDDGANIEHDIEAMNDEEEVVYDEDDVIHPPIVST